MNIYIEKKNKTISMKFKGSVKELLQKLKINPETVLVARNNELVTEDTILNNSDNIKILSVISGG